MLQAQQLRPPRAVQQAALALEAEVVVDLAQVGLCGLLDEPSEVRERRRALPNTFHISDPVRKGARLRQQVVVAVHAFPFLPVFSPSPKHLSTLSR